MLMSFAISTEGLCRRLRDPDAKLRAQALTKLLEMASEDVTVLRVETLVEMGQRVKDKKPEIVSQTLIGMSKLYGKHLSSQLPGIDTLIPDVNSANYAEHAQKRGDKEKKKKYAPVPEFDVRKVARPEVLERCQFIPSLVINCWGYPDTPTRHLVMQVLQEFILPKVARAPKTDAENNSQGGEPPSIDSVRATALLLLYDVLSEADRNSLGSILGSKTKVRSSVVSYLKFKIYHNTIYQLSVFIRCEWN